MPKILINAPQTGFDAAARKTIAADISALK